MDLEIEANIFNSKSNIHGCVFEAYIQMACDAGIQHIG